MLFKRPALATGERECTNSALWLPIGKQQKNSVQSLPREFLMNNTFGGFFLFLFFPFLHFNIA
jgi:hypothetical protein